MQAREKVKRINCFQCQFYYVTWNNLQPHGCRSFGFMSKDFPSLAVFRSSGKSCLAFRSKPSEGNKGEAKRGYDNYF